MHIYIDLSVCMNCKIVCIHIGDTTAGEIVPFLTERVKTICPLQLQFRIGSPNLRSLYVWTLVCMYVCMYVNSIHKWCAFFKPWSNRCFMCMYVCTVCMYVCTVCMYCMYVWFFRSQRRHVFASPRCMGVSEGIPVHPGGNVRYLCMYVPMFVCMCLWNDCHTYIHTYIHLGVFRVARSW